MRETLKSLSIFSASLLLLLVVASGCVVNIPGCGKRSLPLFKQIKDTRAAESVPAAPTETVESSDQNAVAVTGASVVETTDQVAADATTAAQAVNPAAKPPEKEIAFTPPMSPTPRIPIAAPSATPTVTATSTPWEVERIAYTTEEGGKFVLYTMNPDGTGRLRHTPPQNNVYWPLWSPNGKVLAFLSDMVEGKLNLFVMKKENQGIQQLTFFDDLELPGTKALKTPLTWSPRSDQVAFLYKGQVWVVNALLPSTPQSLATTDPLFHIVGLEWTPRRDNKYIAYMVKEGEQNYSLWLANPRLKDLARIAQVKRDVSCFTWISDATHIDYIADSLDVYQCAYESFVQKPVYISPPKTSLGSLIACSPVENATTFLLLAKQPGDTKWRVAVIEKPSTGPDDAGTLKYLTDPGADYAVWSPDGAKIAYLADDELWVMDASGENKKRVAVSGILQPVWSRK